MPRCSNSLRLVMTELIMPILYLKAIQIIRVYFLAFSYPATKSFSEAFDLQVFDAMDKINHLHY